MPRPRGVRPDTVTLSLSDGDTLQVKRVLTAKESRLVSFGALKGKTGERVDMDGMTLAFTAAAIYITGWSFVDLDGAPIFWPANAAIEERIAVLGRLDEATFNEIEAALTKHRQAVAAEQEKNAPGTGTGTASSSPSAPAASGA